MFLLFVSFFGKAQKQADYGLYTDRDIYASGETLLLKVFAPSNAQNRIVNIDLINSKGEKITKIAMLLIDNQSDGYIYLPDSLSSGCYILRTSSRSGLTQTVKELYIANRFAALPEQNVVVRPAAVIPVKGKNIQELEINGLEKYYKRRAKGAISLQIHEDLLTQIEGNIHVNIAEATPEFNSVTFTLNAKSAPGKILEKEGIIVEGVVSDLKTAQPVKNAVVFLSIPDSLPRFNYFITGEDGLFYFQLKNYYGKIPVVLQCYDKLKNQPLKISLSDPESLRGGLPVFENSTFPPELQKKIEQNIEAITIRKIFNHQEIRILPAPRPKADTYPFYGIPTNIVYPKLFTDLPDFSEISRELLPGVKFRAYNRIPTLQLFNSGMRMYFNDPPLLLLDGTPIRDLNMIKEMDSQMIKKAEICLNERFYGDLSFPGVLAIYTTKYDSTRVIASDDLIRVNLDGIQPKATFCSPLKQSITEPDLRQVLLWEPSIKPGQKIVLDFQISDIKGSYKLIIHGKTKDGLLFYKEQFFEVN